MAAVVAAQDGENIMPKHKYIATFADGSIATRTSDREYTVAIQSSWLRDNGERYFYVSFAADASKAQPHYPVWSGCYRGMSSARRAVKMRERDAQLAAMQFKTEIVQAVKS